MKPLTPEQLAKERQSMARDYAAVFNTAGGKRVLDDLRRQFADRTSFVSANPYATAFKEGERGVVLYIDRMIRGDVPVIDFTEEEPE